MRRPVVGLLAAVLIVGSVCLLNRQFRQAPQDPPSATGTAQEVGSPALKGAEPGDVALSPAFIEVMDPSRAPLAAEVTVTESVSAETLEATALRPGRWKVSVREPTDVVVQTKAEGYGSKAVRWKAAPGETLRVTLDPRRTLIVRVTGARDGAMRDARCYVTEANRPRAVISARTDETGQAIIDASRLPSGPLLLEVRHARFLKHSQALPAVDADVTVDVQLKPGVALILRGPKNQPSWLLGQPVSVLAYDESFSDMFGVDGGAFLDNPSRIVGYISPGHIRFRVRVCGIVVLDREDTVTVPEYVVDLGPALAQVRQLRLRTTDAAGAPVSSVRCSILSGHKSIGSRLSDESGGALLIAPPTSDTRIHFEAVGFQSRTIDSSDLSPGRESHDVRLDRIALVPIRVELHPAVEYELSLVARGRGAFRKQVTGTSNETTHPIPSGSYDYDLRVSGGRRFKGVFVAGSHTPSLRPSPDARQIRFGLRSDAGPFPIHGVVGSSVVRGTQFTISSPEEVWLELSATTHAVHVFSREGPVRVGQVLPGASRIQIGGITPLGDTVITLRALDRSTRRARYGTRAGVLRPVALPDSGVLELHEHLTAPVTWRVEATGFETELPITPGVPQEIEIGYRRDGQIVLNAATVIATYKSGSQTNRVVLDRESDEQWRLPRSTTPLLILGMEGRRRVFGTTNSSSSKPDLTSLADARLLDDAGNAISGRIELHILGERRGKGDVSPRMVVMYAEVRDGSLRESDVSYFGRTRCLIRAQTDFGRGEVEVPLVPGQAPKEVRIPLRARNRPQ